MDDENTKSADWLVAAAIKELGTGSAVKAAALFKQAIQKFLSRLTSLPRS